MTARHLDRALDPKSIAVIGASARPGGLGAGVTANVLAAFEGPVALVNPKGGEIAGRPVLRRIEDLDGPVDLAVVVTPPRVLEAVVRALAAKGVKAAAIITDPRRGPEPAGRVRSALRAIARDSGMRIFGPNALGIGVPRSGLAATMSRLRALPGPIAFVGQSATAAAPLVDWARSHGVGFSAVVSLGDMVDVDYADLLDFWSEDPRTRLIVVYAERVPLARKFLSAARQAARIKPVVVMKPEVSAEDGERDAVFDAAFRRAGMIRVRTLEDLFAAVEALAVRLPADARPAPGPRLAILANGESLAAIGVDTLRQRGGALAQLSGATVHALGRAMPPGRPRANPVDVLPDADGARYASALQALLDDPAVDSVLVAHAPTGMTAPEEAARAVAAVMAKTREHPGRRRPWVMASWTGGAAAAEARRLLGQAQIPHFDTPSQAVRAFTVLVAHAHTQARLREPPERGSGPADAEAASAAIAGALRRASAALSPEEAKALLGAYGISLEDGARRAFAWRIAMTQDAEFGPALRFGIGGVAGRALDDAVAGLPPLNATLARDLVESHPLARRIVARGFEPEPEALAGLLAAVGDIVVRHPQVAALTLDPVWVADGRWFCGGAEIAVTPATGTGSERLAIRPYPRELESAAQIGGVALTLRPVRADDEPALAAFYGALEGEDARLRFHRAASPALRADVAARLAQLDYAREMAFVAVDADAIVGEARLHMQADGESAEFAVVVASAWKGRGLGRLLMERLGAYAAASGVALLFGLVLRENTGMLKLGERLGFRPAAWSDPGVVRIERRLRA